MNHVYRRIWSAAKRCWVVGSELTKRGPAARRSVSVAMSAAMLALSANAMAIEGAEKENPGEETETIWNEQEDSRYSGMPMDLFAMTGGLNAGLSLTSIAPQSTHYQLAIVNDVAYRDSTATGDDTVVVGSRSTISGKRSVGYGNGIRSTGERNVAIGTNVKIEHWYATAVGDGAYAGGGWGATAYGNDSRADGGNAIAIGSGSRVATGGGIGGIALGGDARAGTSGYSGAIAVGNKSNASYDAMAIGYESSASASGAVALGRGSVASEANSVSVGNSSTKRRVVNVADARLNSTSSDAVTGKQLNATNSNVTAARSVADSAKTNADSALAKANTLSGLLSQTSASGNVRIGASNSGTVLDVRNSASANRKVTGVADGTLSTTSTDAVSGKQLNATNSNVTAARSVADSAKTSADSALAKANTLSGLLSQTSASGNVRIGASNSGTVLDVRNSASANRKITGVADATLSTASTDAVSGKQLNSTNSNVAAARAVADSAKTNADSALAKANTLSGLLSETSASGSVRLGASNSGTVLDVRNSASANRRITGVADATLSSTSTDAVTGRQLNATNSNVSTAMSDASSAKTAANTALTQVGTLNGLLNQVSASGNVRVGEKNSGTVLDVRNSANANRKLTGVADGVVSASSYEAVNGRQLSATNDKVTTVEGMARSAGADAAVAKTDATKALAETAALGGLVEQVSASGDVRLGGKNSGATLDVRNSANANRKISGVADGILSASSAEAVSGRQLHSTNSRVSDLEDIAQFVNIGSAPFSERAEAGVAGVAVGNSAKTGLEGGTAVGTFAEAMGKNSTAIGRAATVSVDSENGFALGVGAQVGGDTGGARGGVAIGAGASVEGGALNSLALGMGSQADEVGVASFGSVGIQRRLVNIARGTADHNATTVSQLKDSLATLGGGAGMDANGNIIAPTYAMQGGTQSNVEDALMALDGAVVTAGRRADKVEVQLSSIFQDSPSARADGMSQIALNGVNGMVLTNLADGRVAPGSRDAVTGSQLYAAEQKISQNRNDLEGMRKEREMGEQVIRGLDASVIDYGGARLTGVAEAMLSADSSDVVRGSQLYRTNSRVSELEDVAQFVSIGSAPFSERAEAGVAGVAVGNSAKTGLEGGTAVGTFAEAMGKNSTAIGRAAAVSVDSANGFAMGVGAQVGGGAGGANEGIAIGAAARVEGGAHGSLALGNGSLADEEGVVSFGGVGIKRRLVNIANGTADHNAATVGQLRGALSALGGEVDANGNIVGPSFNVQGQSQSTLNGALEALDGAVVSTTSRVNQVESQLRSVFQETPSVRADGTHQLTLAGANGMVISNVANGLIAAGSRDAVNGGQLHSMQQQLNGRMDGLEQRIDDQPQARAMAAASTPSPSTEEIAPMPETSGSPQIASTGEGDKPTPQPKSKQDDTPKPQVDTADLEKMLARANEYTDGAISTFERRLDKMDKRFNRMAAMSSAQAAMAMNTAGLATYNRLGAGVGYSEGESAMAVGYQRVLNEKGSATFSLNGAFTNSGERSMGVGVGIGW
ncbi:TPA: YadA-like family protein [Stenotrophomonas maltophilia]|nr:MULTISPECIES: ESPR-type extended signal peptide-containing protein [Stenotrophomonas]MBH1605552.1 YadA-like family protein [Stenotrophomonas maltophilia]MDQ7290200.1 ESPR-type extended signal peptide-containing protein [Stenotrophomonas sp. Sm2128]MDT3474041.1 ESPR-type extended signal peptide-containing protein [Stenotrophomonas maltophilia]HDS1832687.1 YadA-like family protein [Stenotrophomonas maltophilia]HDX0788555.1 YadA-like family protein [Stenotrophomonas maltophilia]